MTDDDMPIDDTDQIDTVKEECFERLICNLGYLIGIALHCVNILGIRIGGATGKLIICASFIANLAVFYLFFKKRRFMQLKSLERQFVYNYLELQQPSQNVP